MPSKPEIRPDSAAGPARVEPSFTGYFFKAPSEIEMLVQLTHAELKVYLSVTQAIQRDRNGGLLAMSQIAKRANLSERHARKAIESLCQRRWLLRVNRVTGAELTRKEEWNGRTVTYANPIQWWQKDTGNPVPTGQRSGPDDDGADPLRNVTSRRESRRDEECDPGPGNLRPVGQGYLRPVGQRHSEYSECRDSKPAQPQVEPSAFCALVVERSDGHKLITGFASAKSAEGSPGGEAVGETTRTQTQKADAPAKPAGGEQNPSMRAKTQNPTADDEATSEPEEDLADVLSDFHPAELEDWDGSGVPDWVYDATLNSAPDISADAICEFLRQKAATGWQPAGWTAIPALIRATFAPPPKPAQPRPWTASELQTVRDCGSTYMEGDAPPENFASNCELAADGHTAAEVVAYLDSKYVHKRYRPGGKSGPSSWNWFYAVIRNHFSATERGRLPEQPAAPHSAHQATAEQLQRGIEVLDGSLVTRYICKCGAEIRQYTDRVEGTCTCGQAKPISRAGAAQMPAPGKRRSAGGRQ